MNLLMISCKRFFKLFHLHESLSQLQNALKRKNAAITVDAFIKTKDKFVKQRVYSERDFKSFLQLSSMLSDRTSQSKKSHQYVILFFILSVI